jgi:hypothetical protein
MQVRTLLAVVAGMLVIGFAGVMMLARTTARRNADADRRLDPARLHGAMVSAMPAVVPDAALIGRYTAAGGQPRLVANLATRVGDVIVSVRQAYAADRVRSLFDNARQTGPLGVWQLVLQSNIRSRGGADASASPATDARGPDVDIRDVIAIDDHGVTMTPVEPPVPLGGSTPTAGGRSYTFFLSAPHARAELIRTIRGKLHWLDSGVARSPQPFEITNVPLPGTERLFGEMTPLRSGSRSGRPAAPGLLVGASLDDVIRYASSDLDMTDLPYLRLVLPVGVETGIQPVLPRTAPQVTLSATPDADGNIAVRVRVGPSRYQVTVWDREPFALVLPGGANETPTVLQMNLSRSDETIMLPAARALFAAEGRTPAGSVVVPFSVRGRPVGPAVVPVTIRRLNGSQWTQGETTEAPIRANGQAIIANLRPGTYRFRFHAERLAPLGVTGGMTLERYLLKRYKVAFGRWDDAVEQEIEVLPGGRAYGRPVRFLPRGETP